MADKSLYPKLVAIDQKTGKKIKIDDADVGGVYRDVVSNAPLTVRYSKAGLKHFAYKPGEIDEKAEICLGKYGDWDKEWYSHFAADYIQIPYQCQGMIRRSSIVVGNEIYELCHGMCKEDDLRKMLLIHKVLNHWVLPIFDGSGKAFLDSDSKEFFDSLKDAITDEKIKPHTKNALIINMVLQGCDHCVFDNIDPNNVYVVSGLKYNSDAVYCRHIRCFNRNVFINSSMKKGNVYSTLMDEYDLIDDDSTRSELEISSYLVSKLNVADKERISLYHLLNLINKYCIQYNDEWLNDRRRWSKIGDDGFQKWLGNAKGFDTIKDAELKLSDLVFKSKFKSLHNVKIVKITVDIILKEIDSYL